MPQTYPLQTQFWKSFGRQGIFLGTVVRYNPTTGFYRCDYVDGDSEDLSEDELERWLKRYKPVGKEANPKPTRTKSPPPSVQSSEPRKRRNSRGASSVASSAAGNDGKVAPIKRTTGRGAGSVASADSHNTTDNAAAATSFRSWQESFDLLKIHKETIGTTNVSKLYDLTLANWVYHQRRLSKSGTLPRDKEDQLNSLGFFDNQQQGTAGEVVVEEERVEEEAPVVETTETSARSWDESFQALKEYKTKYRSTNVPLDFEGDPELGAWVDEQRSEWKKGTLDDDHFQQLDDLYFVWDPPRSWDEYMDALRDYKERFEDANVPRYWQEDVALGRWVAQQRKRKREKSLTTSQVRQLNQLTFDFVDPTRKRPFSEILTLLLDFQKEFGHVNVPEKYRDDPKLGKWVRLVRSGNITLSENRRQQLDDLGFAWSLPRPLTWREQYTKLRHYKKRYGNCNIPLDYKKDAALGSWVEAQRRQYDQLTQDRRKLLDKIGFEVEASGKSERARGSRGGSSHHSRGSSARRSHASSDSDDDSEEESRDRQSEISSLNGSLKSRGTASSGGMKMHTGPRRRSSSSTMNSPGARKRRRILTMDSRSHSTPVKLELKKQH